MGLAQTEHGAVTHAELSADAVIAPPVFGEAPDCRDTFDLSKSGWLTAGHEGLDRDLVEVFGVLTGRGGFGVRVVDVIFRPRPVEAGSRLLWRSRAPSSYGPVSWTAGRMRGRQPPISPG